MNEEQPTTVTCPCGWEFHLPEMAGDLAEHQAACQRWAEAG